MSKGKKIIAAFAVAAAFLCLLKLGFWQLERLAWKEDLMARIDGYQTQSVDLLPYVTDSSAEFRRGTLTGRWVPDDTFRTKPRLMDGNFGYWIVTPLQLPDQTSIPILRGWVQDGQQDRVLNVPLPEGDVTVTGTLRRPGALADYLPQKDNGWVVFMDHSYPADHAELVPAPVAVELRNDHKQYAIFWFTMAGVLLVMTGFSLLRRR